MRSMVHSQASVLNCTSFCKSVIDGCVGLFVLGVVLCSVCCAFPRRRIRQNIEEKTNKKEKKRHKENK